MKHKPMATANAVAATTVIVYVICRGLVGLFPDLSFTVAQSWFHGIELERLNTWNLYPLITNILTSTSCKTITPCHSFLHPSQAFEIHRGI